MNGRFAVSYLSLWVTQPYAHVYNTYIQLNFYVSEGLRDVEAREAADFAVLSSGRAIRRRRKQQYVMADSRVKAAMQSLQNNT